MVDLQPTNYNDSEVQNGKRSKIENIEKETISYLILGDGDFTYSLDLCRFIQAHLLLTQSSRANRIVCTGIDPLEQLLKKYHDARNTLKRIQSIGSKSLEPRKKSRTSMDVAATTTKQLQGALNNLNLTISIHHCVNAIRLSSDENNSLDCTNRKAIIPTPLLPSNLKYDIVIFNHPHLGTEDAMRHSRFLSHLFSTCIHHWLAKGGVLHLTVVKKQCERWDCINRAKKIGLKLLRRSGFVPPSIRNMGTHQGSCSDDFSKIFCDDDVDDRYHCRRHQSGKSFASRTHMGSETLTFGREDEHDCKGDYHLPWDLGKDDDKDANMLQCLYCEKKFRDERARKNHMKCVHPDGMKKEGQSRIMCAICSSKKDQPPRYFSSQQALEAHILAKHSGPYTDVKPDWAAAEKMKEKMKKLEPSEIKADFGFCAVCDLQFTTMEMRDTHFQEFVPPAEDDNETTESIFFACPKCGKKFKNQRAQRQHVNFCLKKHEKGR